MRNVKRKTCSQSKTSSKGKRGLHILIPVFLFLFGGLLFCYAGWNLFKETYLVGSMFFNKSNVKIEERKFVVNDIAINRPKLGSEFAKLNIPSISLDYPIIHGDDDDDLAKGIGHYAGSTIPGENGNVVLAGHRDTVFRNLGKVKIGDMITIKTYYGTYNYKASKIRIVNSDDRTVVVTSDKEMLTIYTCYPFDYIGSAPKRYVLVCDFMDGSTNKESNQKEGKWFYEKF